MSTMEEDRKFFLKRQAEVVEEREDKRWEKLSKMSIPRLKALKRDLITDEYDGVVFCKYDLPKIEQLLDPDEFINF